MTQLFYSQVAELRFVTENLVYYESIFLMTFMVLWMAYNGNAQSDDEAD